MICLRRSFLLVALIGLASCNSPVSTGTPVTGSPAETSPSNAPTGAAVSVLLYADSSEAESSCGCGEIIRAVRHARDRGVSVQEVSPENPGDVAKRYKIMVAPTVLLLDAKGEVTTRYEGESKDTVAALKSALERLTPQKGGA